MLPKLRYINGKTYRYGFTTGSCAAAAAKAATSMLLSGQLLSEIRISTPAGIDLSLKLEDIDLKQNSVSCSVIKDSGDDPDVTHGIKVFAKAFFNDEKKLIVGGGVGIGRVTKKGLQVPVGEWAINPMPMKMICDEVQSLLTVNQGVTIEIFIPEGVEIAKKTFNERLGITGGISVLGSSGIVVPMSEEAFKESLALELSVLKEKGYKEIILTPGNYGQSFIAAHLPNAKEFTVTTSNFIGYMLYEAVRYGMKKVLLVGHIGKLVKVAGGIFHTHSSVADARNEILAAHYMSFTGNAAGFTHIMQSNTTEEAIENIENKEFFDYLCGKIQGRCKEHIRNAIEIDVIIFSQDKGLLGNTEGANIYLNQHL